MIADSSNYINQKKIEINRKQERARILMDEFVREAEATCQGKNKDILRWLDTVFQGQYLPSLRIIYVAINKVLEKLPPQLY